MPAEVAALQFRIRACNHAEQLRFGFSGCKGICQDLSAIQWPEIDFSANHARSRLHRDDLLLRQLECRSRFSRMHNIHELNCFARITRSSKTADPKRRATADPNEQRAYTAASNQEWILSCISSDPAVQG